VRNFPKIVAAGLGIIMVVFGLWAFLAPHSFYAQVAGFGTYNVHLLHDIGAFQTGLGAALLAALVWNDALVVVLTGGSVATVMHAIAHVIDRNLGIANTKKEPVELIALAVVVVAGWLTALRARSRRS
jgi:hypothetical protein